jgi:hypothetical protein
MPIEPNHRLIAASKTMPDNERAMLIPSNRTDPPRSPNKFDVALASIAKGQHPFWTFMLMSREGFPWGAGQHSLQCRSRHANQADYVTSNT